ncbi:MAG: hypothetical protein LW645_06280 [Verrucomicrobiaceae bacterium]|nr:hypothetical protein [Verrucomicrobiaceae bacterium]
MPHTASIDWRTTPHTAPGIATLKKTAAPSSPLSSMIEDEPLRCSKMS